MPSLSSKEVDLINKVLKKIDDEVPKVKKFVSKKKVTKSKSKKKTKSAFDKAYKLYKWEEKL